MPPKAKKRKRRVVVDTSVLVAGMSGFKETYLPGKNPSADVLHDWAEEHNFSCLIRSHFCVFLTGERRFYLACNLSNFAGSNLYGLP